jgi:two-component system response regulator NreC
MVHKIVIVDDSALVRREIRAAIELRGWNVCGEAENGRVGIEMVSSHQPHLIILDLSMPVMSGLDAAREISKIVPGLPMVMFTNHDYPALAELARKAGIKHVFSKVDGITDAVFAAMTKLLALPNT